ncbi:restriction endonuclease subunit S [Hymenobacter sediminis]|uniref:restriction endonuclease subunit S n=1 Tax=Hymenobacter sediminis TaxID=2218621 RepID=UPI000DA644DF|nr:restriction endonuclease subunit S [Hymenobacter sediminis]RPD43763.1 restriction endonuclease subunit S [Hymenobacter sediminis]
MSIVPEVLPAGWRKAKLGEIAELNPGRSVKLSDNDSVTFLAMPDVSEEGRVVNKQSRPFGSVRNGFTTFQDGDVLVAKITPCFENGKGALVEDLENGVGFGSTEFHVVRALDPEDQAFIWLHTTSRNFRALGERMMTGSAGHKRVPADFISGYEIPLPPSDQRHRITELLGTWDEAVQLQAKLLDDLRTRQKALSHRLLLGQVRLPGFEGIIKEVPISSLTSEVVMRNRDDSVSLVLSCTKYDGLVDSLTYFGRKIYSDDLSTYKVVPRNTFAYATNHIEEGSIGYQRDYDAGLVSPMYTVFRTNPNKVNDEYFYLLLKSEEYIGRYKRNMSGSVDRRGGLRWADFASIKVPAFSLPEQQAIAEVLNTGLAEIRLREAELADLREQKRGLMQQLLTGQKLLR